MSKILIVAEHVNGKLNAATARCLTAARQIGGDIDIVVLAADPSAVAAQAAALDGVSRVLAVANAANVNALGAVIAPQVVAVAGSYTHVLGPSTTFGKDLMPRVAALLGEAQISDIMKVIDARTFERPIYAGNAIITVKVPEGRKVVATIRSASYPATGAGAAAAAIEATTVDAALPSHTRYVKLEAGASDRPDLQTAARVISGGRALGSAENFQLIYGLADKLGAGVGASRAAVDAGYAPNDMQVGQTGKIIAPELYVAIGISGAIQHLTGIKDAGTIVAINKDGEAPIFEIADFGLVGDLFKIIPELEQAIG
jgi:electron transfer flavoprotein alpha subunit